MGQYTIAVAAFFIVLSNFAAAAGKQTEDTKPLSNPYFKLQIGRDGAISGLQVDQTGKGKAPKPEFARHLSPDNWEAVKETRITGTNTNAVVGPLRIWQPQPITIGGGAAAATLRPEKLLPGQTLSQTFSIPGGVFFDTVSVHLST